MRFELEDITGREKVWGNVHVPPSVTLGQMFDTDERLRQFADAVVQCRYNGVRIDKWREISPAKGDSVKFSVGPGGPIVAFVAAAVGFAAGVIGGTAGVVGGLLTAAFGLVSIVQFGISLFSRPKQPKQRAEGSAANQSPTYGFEGIQNTFTPGNPVPIIYGEPRTGGQLLSMAVDVTSGGQRHELSMLMGLGEGPVTEVSCVRINGIAVENFPEITTVTRVGSPSQAVIPGFEQIRNTFSDGREVGSASNQITYTTNGTSVQAVDVQISAMRGLWENTSGGDKPNRVTYSVEYRPTGTTTYTVAGTRDWTGHSLAEIWDVFRISSLAGNQYDLRPTLLSQATAGAGHGNQISLRNVTEIMQRTETFSGVALLAIRSIATAQLHGGRPTITSMVRGHNVRAYSDPVTFINTWTRNPAWCVLDYMTNSVYGMGAFITTSDVDIQSFIDFGTICNTLVPDGSGGTEAQHMLDIVMDVRKPQWTWLQDLLGNYRSNVIYSNGVWKIITDRADLPLRQVFHSGNMIPGATEVRIGGDPLRPNRAEVHFSNRDIDFEQDVLFVTASGTAATDPVKSFDISLIGVVRQSEAMREASWQISRRRGIRSEVSWSTGLEALAVEPGDMARVGIVTQDFEMGYGGRADGGSTAHLLADREFEVRSGYAYDLFVWHTQADTPETRTLANSLISTGPFSPSATTYLVASPTVAFTYAVRPGDRWALGINSEDIMLVRVKSMNRAEDGTHQIVGEQFVSLAPTAPSIVSTAPSFDLEGPPSQPISVVVSESVERNKDGTLISRLVLDVSPPPREIGGRITNPGTTGSVTLADSHTPVNNALNNEHIRMITGAASGYAGRIGAWNFSTRVASVIPSFGTVAASGDAYTMEMRMAQMAGFDLHWRTATDSGYAFMAQVMGNRGSIVNAQYAQTYNLKVIPFSDRGVRNEIGPWVVTYTTTGDVSAPATPSGLAAVGGYRVIELTWTANSETDLGEYRVHRNTANAFGTSSLIAEVRANKFIDSAVTAETSYFYWIRAIDLSENLSPIHPGSTAGVSAVASLVPNTSVATVAPSAPTNIAVGSSANYTAKDGTDLAFVQLTWTNPTDVNRAYADVLYRRAGNPDYIIADQTSATVARVDDLTPGIAYDYAIRAVSRFGVPSALNTLNNQTAPSDTIAPATPSGLTAALGVGRTVVLDWDDNTESDFAYYELYRNTSNAFGSATKLGNALTSRFTDVVSASETPYFYWIRAADRSGNLSPIHPGSTAGVTISSSKIVTAEVASLAFTNVRNFASDPTIPFGTAATTVGFLTITTSGAGFVLIGKVECLNDTTSDVTATMELRRGDIITGPLLDTTVGLIAGSPNGDVRSQLSVFGNENPGAGTFTYYLVGKRAGNGGAISSTRFLQALEILR